VEARVIDLSGVYDPCRPSDRLLLGMKGSISGFELGVLRGIGHLEPAVVSEAAECLPTREAVADRARN
jgi:hypothetical protein